MQPHLGVIERIPHDVAREQQLILGQRPPARGQKHEEDEGSDHAETLSESAVRIKRYF